MNVNLIGKSLFLEDNLIEADVAIVFGMNDWKRPAKMAIDLHRSGNAHFLLFSGGYNNHLRAYEAVEMSKYAREYGLPDRSILVESRAAHTEENVILSKAILDDHPDLRNLRAVTLVTIHYHLRRAILAARRHFPPSVAVGWVSYPSLHYSAADWDKSERGRSDVGSEISKIEKYYSLSVDDLAGQHP